MKPDPLKPLKKKKKKRKGDEWELDDSDHPVHEKYTEMEPVKD
jgi:hypothetical protein